jgi:hypothetical protein
MTPKPHTGKPKYTTVTEHLDKADAATTDKILLSDGVNHALERES